jgi:hypothetical protein
MVRKLAWLFVVLLIVADVVLVTTMLRTSGPSRAARASSTAGGHAAFPAPEMVSPTRSGRAASAPAGSAPVSRSASAPGSAPAAAAAAPALPAPPDSTPTSPPESGQIQVLGESRDEDAPPDTAAESAGILLQIGADGVILRAARGACPSTAAAALAISRDSGVTWTPVPAAVAQVLAVGASSAGTLWFVGTDSSCRPTARESRDGGAGWTPGSVRGRWYLNPDPASTDVASPRLLSNVGCVPAALAGIDARRAVALCTGGDIRVTDDSGDTWITASRIPGAVSLSFDSTERGYALAAARGCPAAVLRTVDGAQTWARVACLGDDAPMAIAAASSRAAGTLTAGDAAAADTVVAQVGAVLSVSRDGGRSWRTE